MRPKPQPWVVAAAVLAGAVLSARSALAQPAQADPTQPGEAAAAQPRGAAGQPERPTVARGGETAAAQPEGRGAARGEPGAGRSAAPQAKAAGNSETGQEGGETPAEPEHVNEEPLEAQPPLRGDEERELPDYDGRGDEPTTVGDVAIWVPRIALAPAYLVSEYLVRQPLGWVVTRAEQEELPAILIDFFTFGPDRSVGIIPTTLIDFGFKPSVGLYFYWNDFLADRNDLRVRGATWGPDWITASVADHYEFRTGHEVGLRGGFTRRPDWVFHGLGPESGSVETRYSERRADVALEYDARLWRSSRFSAHMGIRDSSFDADSGCCGDPTVADAVAAGRFPLPPGFADGYTILRTGFDAALDSRERRNLDAAHEGSDHVSPPGGGVRLDLRGEHAAGLRTVEPDGQRLEWIRYGGTVGGFVDVDGYQRVLGLSVVADFADPLRRGGEIPFTEQVHLGGERPLRGFLEGRLRDRSAAVALLEYRWPVWVWFDGAIHYGVGNVFGAHLEGFELGRLRQSFGLGLRANSARDHAFEILAAFGTRTFDDGGGIEHFRLVFGATSGF